MEFRRRRIHSVRVVQPVPEITKDVVAHGFLASSSIVSEEFVLVFTVMTRIASLRSALELEQPICTLEGHQCA